MQCMKRYKKYIEEDLDLVLLNIKKGTIKSVIYSNILKVNVDKKKLKGVVFFGEDSSESE